MRALKVLYFLLLIVYVIVYSGIAYLFINDAVRDRQQKAILTELSHELDLPSGYQLISSDYVDADCLDVCPTITLHYKVPKSQSISPANIYIVPASQNNPPASVDELTDTNEIIKQNGYHYNNTWQKKYKGYTPSIEVQSIGSQEEIITISL